MGRESRRNQKGKKIMGKICLTQVVKDLDGQPMTVEQTGLPAVVLEKDLQTLEPDNIPKYVTRGGLCFLKKEFEKSLLFRHVLTGALLHRVEEEDKTLSNEALMERVMLAQKVHEAESFSFTAEQIVLLKKLVNRRWAPANLLIVGRAFEMLEPKEEEEAIPRNGHLPEREREQVTV